MSLTDQTRVELDALNQRQAEEEAAAQAQLEAAQQTTPDTFADPVNGHVDHFNYVEHNGFLATFFESIPVNFGPNPDPNIDTGLQRDVYFGAAGFTRGDPSMDHRQEFGRIADTNAPPPMGNTDLSGKIAQVTNFSRGNGDAVTRVYESFDEIYGETILAAASADVHRNFAQAAANADTAPAQVAENNYAPELSNPAA